jgi:Na+/H+-dicarboxylate symporter
VGRVGIKTLAYLKSFPTLALIIGLIVALEARQLSLRLAEN